MTVGTASRPLLRFSHVEIACRPSSSGSFGHDDGTGMHGAGDDSSTAFVLSDDSDEEVTPDSAKRKRPRSIPTPIKRSSDAAQIDRSATLQRELQAKVDELQTKVKELTESLADERATSKARKNTNKDHLAKLTLQKELEQMLRDELRGTTSDHERTKDLLARRDEELVDNVGKHSHALCLVKESRDELQAKVNNLEEDLRKMNAEVRDLKAQVLDHGKTVKKKDEYIAQLHREGDAQDEKLRTLRAQDQELKTEIDTLRAQKKRLEDKCQAKEREHAAALVRKHAELQQQFRTRENDLLRRNYALENGTAQHESTSTLGLLNLLARARTATETTGSKATDGEAVAATASSLSSNEKDATIAKLLLEKAALEADLRREREQVAGAAAQDGGETRRLEALVDGQRAELLTLRRSLDEASARAERLEELAAVGRGAIDRGILDTASWDPTTQTFRC